MRVDEQSGLFAPPEPDGETGGHLGKLTLEQVLDVKRRYAGGLDTQTSLARRYGVSQATVSRAIAASWMWSCSGSRSWDSERREWAEAEARPTWRKVALPVLSTELRYVGGEEAPPPRPRRTKAPPAEPAVLRNLLAHFDELRRADPVEVARAVGTPEGARSIYRDYYPEVLAWLQVFFEELRTRRKNGRADRPLWPAPGETTKEDE